VDASSVYIGRKLLERIEERRSEYTKPMVAGQMEDFGTYKFRAGYLTGLSDAIAMLEAINLEDQGSSPFARTPQNQNDSR
jgi:hypothetical protein